MTLLGKIIREILLTEEISMGDVSTAIDNHDVVVVNYHSGGKDEHSGPRVIEPYALGLTKAGNPVVRAFEISGDSRSGVSRGWKFMRLDRLSSWEPTGETFTQPASNIYQGLGAFNPDGDRSMSVVYKVAKFNRDEQESLNVPQGGPKTKDGTPYEEDTDQTETSSTQKPSSPTALSAIKVRNAFKGGKKNEKTDSGPRMKDGSVDAYKTDIEEPTIQDTPSEEELNDLRDKLGDTSEPISFAVIKNRLNSTNDDEDVENEEENENI